MPTIQETATTTEEDTPTVVEAPAAVQLEGVSRRFGETVAVHGVDLVLPAGEFFALLGPSGCGKTTTLRMVGGFELPSAGRILLDGRDVTDLPPYRRDVNTVFQSYALFPHLDVFDNVAFGLRRRKLDRNEVRRRVEADLEMVGLGGYGKRRPAQLSGGQQQRVALARALVNRPKVLLLDEPMGALDARIRKTMQVELKRIQREVGITFLYVTHDQAEAMAMSDRLAVMHAGRCEDLGPPDRVYDRPGTQFVAEFLGTCNLLPIESDGSSLRLPDGTPVFVDHADAHGAISGGWRVGIRPEKLVLHADSGGGSARPGGDAGTASVDGRVAAGRARSVDVTDPPGSRDNHLEATVTIATYLGASAEYELVTAWGTRLMVFAQNLGESSRARPGDRVTVRWDPSHGFLLPPAEQPA